MITEAMIHAAAKALYEQTAPHTMHHIDYYLLPQAAQDELHRLAQIVLEAGLMAAPMPES